MRRWLAMAVTAGLTVIGCGCSGQSQSRPAAPRIGRSSLPAAVVAVSSVRAPVGHGRCSLEPSLAEGHGEFSGIQFVSASTGWVVAGNRILATTDGGERWRVQARTSSAQLSSVDFVDASHGWAVANSELLATDDGGRRWRVLAEPCPAIDSVDFVSPLDGYAVAGQSGNTTFPSAVLVTRNGGQRWHRLRTPPIPQSLCFHGVESGWLGADGNIYATVNGGRDWKLSLRSSHSRLSFPADVRLECGGEHAGWAVIVGPGAAMGHVPQVGYHSYGGRWKGIFAEQYTTPSGSAIRVDSPGPEPGPFSAISEAQAAFFGDCDACGAEGSSSLAIAQDGGAQLVGRSAPAEVTQVTAASFISASDGWATGVLVRYFNNHGEIHTRSYRILRTTDGGRSWQTQYGTPPRSF